MDRALILVLIAAVQRERLLIRLNERTRPMAGEIRQAMGRLRAARETMTAELLKEIAAVQGEVEATHKDGLQAMALPRAELEATKAEIAEIRTEFAPKSNGDPKPGPLPGSVGGSQGLSDAAEKKT